ncbi:MAG TPA: GHKL domain-containing protein [Saccharofermentans sp.]|nr:GHKL domain-containing protein [Saccharofermentans sp.]HPE27697.1 GHKL domain-containing protein [Saccharofermentans sp.]HPJ81223.1 GHKL domain-containing protein [Saccharofermentans sp.]HPQ32488.1 GHKL domain-containing protein [Saccharofermentans sp.]HRV50846.1 GHKL domain-containing protein [Saccharofermentans sp.]
MNSNVIDALLMAGLVGLTYYSFCISTYLLQKHIYIKKMRSLRKYLPAFMVFSIALMAFIGIYSYTVLSSGGTVVVIGSIPTLIIAGDTTFFLAVVNEERTWNAFLRTLCAMGMSISMISAIMGIFDNLSSIFDWKDNIIPVIVTSLVSSIFTLIYVSLFSYIWKRNGYEKIGGKMAAMLLMVFVTIAIIVDSRIPPALELDTKSTGSILSLVLVIEIAVVLLYFFIFLVVAQYYNNRNINKLLFLNSKALEVQKEYYENLKNNNLDLRRFKHDYQNHLFTLNELIKSKKYDELESYISTIDKEVSFPVQKFNTGNDIADAIISDKINSAKSVNATIIVKTDINTFLSKLSAYDTCTIIANILDNAIEAVSVLPDGINREISISFKNSSNYLLISSSNPTLLKRSKSLKAFITTEKHDKKNHGLGLLNVKTIAEKLHGDVKYSISNNYSNSSNNDGINNNTTSAYSIGLFTIDIMLSID